MSVMRASLNGGSEYLASPYANHILSYSTPPPISQRIPVVEKTLPAISQSTPAVVVPSVSVLGSGLEASLGLNQSVALTGTPNSPSTPVNANEPGLESVTGVAKVKKNWIVITIIILVILGLLWYFNPGNLLAR